MPLVKILTDGSETGQTAADKINSMVDSVNKNETDVASVLASVTTNTTNIATNASDIASASGMANKAIKYEGTIDITSSAPTTPKLGQAYRVIADATFDASWGMPPAETASAGELLMWDGTGWVYMSSGSGDLSSLTDVDLTNLANGGMLVHNTTSGDWEVVQPLNAFATSNDSDRPIITNNNGKLDASLLDINALVFKGTVDMTSPDTLTNNNIGDLYFNTTAGNWDASWGQGTGPILQNEAIVWENNAWIHLGAMTSIQNLGGIADVAYGGALGEGDYLSYDATNSLWVKSSAPSVDALTDTNLTGITDGQIMVYDLPNTEWVNETPTFVDSEPTGITGATAVVNMVSMSQVDYDAIVTKDPATVYIIKG